jgi:hypothetical protein
MMEDILVQVTEEVKAVDAGDNIPAVLEICMSDFFGLSEKQGG